MLEKNWIWYFCVFFLKKMTINLQSIVESIIEHFNISFKKLVNYKGLSFSTEIEQVESFTGFQSWSGRNQMLPQVTSLWQWFLLSSAGRIDTYDIPTKQFLFS